MVGVFIKKYLILILVFVVCLLSISSVAASNLANDTALNVIGESDDLIKVDAGDINLLDVDLIAKDEVALYSDIYGYLGVTVQDKDGNNVNVGSVTFVNVFGENYTSDVVDGIASGLFLIENDGQCNVTCFYDGMGVYNNASTTFLLTVPIEDTVCHNLIATRYDDIVYFAGNILAVYESSVGEVGEGIVSVYVDGKRVGACGVDSRGNFAYLWKSSKNLIGKTIDVTIEYSHDLNHYHSSELSKTFTFEAPKDTQIISNVNVIDGTRTLVTGIVKDNDGNAVVGGTLDINNLYSIPVDTNGEFRFYVTKSASKKVNYEIGFFDWGSKADITVNQALMNGIKHTSLIDELIDLCKKGIPYIKFGNGNGKTVVMSSGTHGGEIASQVACYNLIDLLANFGSDIDGTIYIFPAIYPEAIANNSRTFNGINMNGVANINGTVSNNFINFAKSVNAAGLGDFHCTRHNDADISIEPDIYAFTDFIYIIGDSEFPGTPSVLCTLRPTPECFSIAEYIHNQTGYTLVYDLSAGDAYSGAIDDNANILGVPAVTCEALTNHGNIEYGSVEVSFNMMLAFLKYFGFDVVEMIAVPMACNDLMLTFTSPYNYNSCFKYISMSCASRSCHHFASVWLKPICSHTACASVNNTTSGIANIASTSFDVNDLLSLVINIILMIIDILRFIYEFLVKILFSLLQSF